MIRLIFTMMISVWGTFAVADSMRLAVTTSFDNSGLADVLLPQIKADIGLDVQLLVVGTGQALRLGAAGDVDAVLVHSRAAEDAFIAAGHGTHRTEIMYNDFVIIGPQSDPANVRSTASAAAALSAIAQSQAVFVSRGDDSGTHKAEIALWDDVAFGPWYRAVGAGMGATLNTASAMNAYTLSDRASWLNFANKGDLQILFSGDPKLFNQYSLIPVNPAKGSGINHTQALALEGWFLGKTAQQMINTYKIMDQPLFVYNYNSSTQ